MTNYYKDNKEALKVAKNSTFIDSRIISKIFKNIKSKGILAETIKINIDPLKKIKTKEKKDLVDQIILARHEKGYSVRELGEKINISQKRLTSYELRLAELKDPKVIKGCIKVLDIKEPQLTDYQRFLLDNPNQKIKQYILDNNIKLEQMEKLLNIKAKTILNWISHDDVLISEESYNKMKRNYNKIFHQEKHNYLEEDEEEEQE